MNSRHAWIIVAVYIAFCALIVYLMYRYLKKKQDSWEEMLQDVKEDTKECILSMYKSAASDAAEELYEDAKAEVLETILPKKENKPNVVPLTINKEKLKKEKQNTAKVKPVKETKVKENNHVQPLTPTQDEKFGA